jgi:glucose/arabinose dehydrogenase
MHRHLAIGLAFSLALLASAGAAWAQPQEPNFSQTNFVSDGVFNDATGMAWAPDGTNRLFISLKGGTSNDMGTGSIRIIKNGALLATPFATESVWRNSECGVIGIAFHPNFAANPYLYAFVTTSSSEQKIIRYNASGDTATGRTELITGLPTAGQNHDGGGIGIGADGKLYWSIGDLGNGTGVDLNTSTLASKVGRANLDGTAPTDNPLYNAGDGIGPTDYIWAAGFRNPFTLTFHPVTGHLWVNVVGTSHEQIFLVQANDHAGWNNYEGGNQPAGTSAAPYGVYIDPKISYATNGGGGSYGGCITGGSFYTGSTFPSHQNNFFWGDYNSGQLMRTTLNAVDHTTVTGTTVFATNVGSIVDTAVGPDGALYYVSRSGNAVRRIQYTAATPQNIVVSTGTLSVNEGASNTFTARLATAPAANVTVNVARSAGSTDVTVSPPSLTFTAANWNTPQTVTVSAAHDGDATNDGATVTCSSSGLTSQNVSVTVVDDDAAGGAPTATITRPVNGEVVSGANAEFYGDGDPQGSATMVRGEFRIDGVLVFTDSTAGGHYHMQGGHNLWNTTTLSNGVHTLELTVFDNGALSGSHQITVTVANNVPAFQQDSGADGLVVMESENSGLNVAQGGHSWTATTAYAGYSGGSARRAMPDTATNHTGPGGYSGVSPRLDYAVNFTRTGTHYVWIRGWAPSGAGDDDSCHVGLDGAEVGSSDRITGFGQAWTWSQSTIDGPVATIDVATPGIHTVNVWMREDGFVLDKILITSNAAYAAPVGTGPAQSAVSGGGGSGGGRSDSDEDKACGCSGLEAFLALALAGLARRRR